MYPGANTTGPYPTGSVPGAYPSASKPATYTGSAASAAKPFVGLIAGVVALIALA